MTCKDFLDFIMGYLDGDLPAEVRAPFERHLALCPDCHRYLRVYETTAKAGQPAFSNPDAQVPPDVPDALVRAILASRRL